jgi:hypothetical protein
MICQGLQLQSWRSALPSSTTQEGRKCGHSSRIIVSRPVAKLAFAFVSRSPNRLQRSLDRNPYQLRARPHAGFLEQSLQRCLY